MFKIIKAKIQMTFKIVQLLCRKNNKNNQSKMSLNAEMNSLFYKLPVEIKTKVFNHLDLNSKNSCRQVCHVWNAIIDRTLVLKPELNDDTCDVLRNSPLPIVHLFVSKFQNNMDTISSDSTEKNDWLADVTKLVFEEDEIGISLDNLEKLLTITASQLTLIQFHSLTLKNVRRFDQLWTKMSFDNISYLTILMYTFQSNHCCSIDNLLSTITFPKLYELKVSFTNLSQIVYCHPPEQYSKILSTVYSFIGKHNSTLRNLWLNEVEQLVKSITNDQPMQIKLSIDDIEALSHLNLLRLRYFLGNFDQNHPVWPAICIANNHSNLITLDICGAPVPRVFLSTITNNLSTLRYLYWTCNFVDAEDVNNSFDISLIANAVNLIHLDISSNEIRNFEYLPRQIQRLVWASDLSIDQLEWISTNMKMIKIFILEENENIGTAIPHLTLLLLISILKMKKLQHFKLYGKYDDKIPEFCTSTHGLEFYEKADGDEEEALSRFKEREGFRVLIKRKLLHPTYLL